jgi:hypothetical protein
MYEQSSTTFYNPSDTLLDEFRSAPEKILSIDNKKPIEKNEY